MVSLGVCMKLCYSGSGNPINKPLSGSMRRVFELITKYHCLAICYLYGYKVSHVFKDDKQVDWSKYLGDNWRVRTEGKSATVWVSNHIGALDIMVHLTSG